MSQTDNNFFKNESLSAWLFEKTDAAKFTEKE